MRIKAPKIETTNISEKVYRWLRESIINLSLPPGQKLSVRELSTALSVSSSPITHALYRLAGEGLVEISPRKETCVRRISKEDIREIWDARVMLETGALEMIKFPLQSGQLKKVHRRCHESLRQEGFEVDTYKRYVEKDYLFHLELMKLSGNSRVVKIYEQLGAHIQLIRFGLMHKIGRASSKINEEHLSILTSLENEDIENMKKEIKSHVMRIKEFDFNPKTVDM